VLELDGDDGGGQLVRSALACAALTGEPFRLTDARGGRSKPGLRPKHAAAVWAVAQICDADVKGGETRSETLVFEPGDLTGGEVRVEVGTAGSVPLVFDAVLPVAYALPEPLLLTVVGGTDTRWAPTMAHHATVKPRVLSRFGLRYRDTVDRLGFYPTGGGEATLHLPPATPTPARLTERGAIGCGRVYAYATDDLEQAVVAGRLADAVLEEHPSFERRVVYRPADSAGAACCLRVTFEGGTVGFDALGEPGKSAEAVARDALTSFAAFRETDAVVDHHTADQVLLPLAVAGGAVAVPEVTGHVASNAALIRSFGGDLRLGESGTTQILQSSGGLGR